MARQVWQVRQARRALASRQKAWKKMTMLQKMTMMRQKFARQKFARQMIARQMIARQTTQAARAASR